MYAALKSMQVRARSMRYSPISVRQPPCSRALWLGWKSPAFSLGLSVRVPTALRWGSARKIRRHLGGSPHFQPRNTLSRATVPDPLVNADLVRVRFRVRAPSAGPADVSFSTQCQRQVRAVAVFQFLAVPSHRGVGRAAGGCGISLGSWALAHVRVRKGLDPGGFRVETLCW